MPGHKMKKDKGYTKMPGGGKGEGMMGYMETVDITTHTDLV